MKITLVNNPSLPEYFPCNVDSVIKNLDRAGIDRYLNYWKSKDAKGVFVSPKAHAFGEILIGHKRAIIPPKHAREMDDVAAMQVLLEMYLLSENVPSPIVVECRNRPMSSRDVESPFEFLQYAQVLQLKKAIRRFAKNYYLDLEDESSAIRGSISFVKSAARNRGLKHRHVINFQDYQPDFLFLSLCKSVVSDVLRMTKSEKLISECTNIKRSLKGIEAIPVTPAVVRTFANCRRSYRAAGSVIRNGVDVLLALLRSHKSLSEAGREQGRTVTSSPGLSAYLFDMNKYYEEMVFESLKTSLDSSEFEVVSGNRRPLSLFGGWVEYTRNIDTAAVNNGGEKRKLECRPDIMILNNEKVVAVMDTKYKIFDGKGRPKIERKDIYQLICHGLSTYFCNNGKDPVPSLHLFYPASSRQEDNLTIARIGLEHLPNRPVINCTYISLEIMLEALLEKRTDPNAIVDFFGKLRESLCSDLSSAAA